MSLFASYRVVASAAALVVEVLIDWNIEGRTVRHEAMQAADAAGAYGSTYRIAVGREQEPPPLANEWVKHHKR